MSTSNSNDVAIIGVGIHPFGRFEGKSAMEMCVDAIDAAVTDAGVAWGDIGAAAGGSWTVANPDAIVGMVGLSGIPFTNVFNACATAASAAKVCADGIRLGDYDIGIAVGLDKHPRGAFTEDPGLVGMPQWYAENGQYLTTQFFGMKANRYLHEHGISQRTLAKVANKNLRNGALNPNAFRRKPIAEDDILNSPMLNYPLTQYMFCAPDEGAAAVVMCRADIAHRYTSKPVYLRAVEIRTRTYGAHEVNTTFAPVDEVPAPTVYAARAAFEKAGISPQDVDVIQLQDTDAGAEIIHMAECGFCPDGDQEKLLADGATEIGGSMPINTDGGLIANGEPIGASGLRQIHELVRQLRGEAGDRQVPGNPRVGFAQLYGAPGTAGATILTL
jgi:acetyl-CoA C-acetyltransferase